MIGVRFTDDQCTPITEGNVSRLCLVESVSSFKTCRHEICPGRLSSTGEPSDRPDTSGHNHNVSPTPTGYRVLSNRRFGHDLDPRWSLNFTKKSEGSGWTMDRPGRPGGRLSTGSPSGPSSPSGSCTKTSGSDLEKVLKTRLKGGSRLPPGRRPKMVNRYRHKLSLVDGRIRNGKC